MTADLANAAPPDAVTGGQDPEADAPTYYTHLDYQITRNDDDYLSVLLSSRQFLGNSETENWTAVVFALSGVYAGQPLSLTQAMGLEQSDGDEASGVSYASTLVYGLVWQIIQEQVSMFGVWWIRSFRPTFTSISSARWARSLGRTPA